MAAASPRPWATSDEGRHHDAVVEEWVFAAWTPDGRAGAISGHRIVGRRAWYWAAWATAGGPTFHVLDDDVPMRADPFIVKGPALWAEHTCDEPWTQWSIGNETYAAALDDPAEALGRAYGVPTPIAFDLEWYAIGGPEVVAHGYRQVGVVHGRIELAGHPAVELAEVPGERWHRWRTDGADLAPVEVPPVRAHGGAWAAFTFPDGHQLDLVLTAEGWRRRGRPPAPPGRPAPSTPTVSPPGRP